MSWLPINVQLLGGERAERSVSRKTAGRVGSCGERSGQSAAEAGGLEEEQAGGLIEGVRAEVELVKVRGERERRRRRGSDGGG